VLDAVPNPERSRTPVAAAHHQAPHAPADLGHRDADGQDVEEREPGLVDHPEEESRRRERGDLVVVDAFSGPDRERMLTPSARALVEQRRDRDGKQNEPQDDGKRVARTAATASMPTRRERNRCPAKRYAFTIPCSCGPWAGRRINQPFAREAGGPA
jgi:hypothetical protein